MPIRPAPSGPLIVARRAPSLLLALTAGLLACAVITLQSEHRVYLPLIVKQ